MKLQALLANLPPDSLGELSSEVETTASGLELEAETESKAAVEPAN